MKTVAVNLQKESEILKLLSGSRYLDALDKCDTALKQDENNFNYHYYKGIANIYLNRLDEALMDLGEAIYINPQHIPSMHAFAYIFFRKNDLEGAINKWFAILQADPKDKLAKRNVNLFKSNPNPQTVNSSPSYFLPLPQIKIRKSRKKLWITLALASVILAIPLTLFVFNSKAVTFLDDLTQFFNREILFTLTEKEIEYYKKQIFELVNDQKYNQAKMLMNKLYHSNASLEDKKLVKTWESRLEYPNKDKLDYNYTPEAVYSNPRIYKDCFVFWEGSITTVSQKNNYLFFEMKLNNEKITGAVFLSNYPLNIGDKIKVLAKISTVSGSQLEIEIFNLEKL
jgi:tetratricopeptide (TPR) repeat protein